ncbi:hypothetical protein ISF_09730 [Cordyceps fumosorosea ARSEF 2679]|uniref:Uncharacterized protein n=1 Tax=Cordyceps fumosorosea (strain ARSEF 2679) TaxID=1081104 RepID=A0A167DEM6_CORFA|nr:hypothetical protein ISF_09730 [Cordyceps fumosorosea ARSEF 2679]OAA42290.1 hypothetical protein ISF_09730 [Cordyceps fumosorosea ARSEF 2679]
MPFSHTQDSTRRTSPTRFPPQWSRKLSDRTGGLYKKANTLFHLEQAKIAVLVSSGDYFHGYLSHGPADWPELHQLASSHGIALATPDDLDTVSQRYASRSQSVVSTGSSSTITVDAEFDPVMQLLSTLEEEPAALASASLPGISSNASAPVWVPPSTPERASRALEKNTPTALMSTEPVPNNNCATNPSVCQTAAPGSLPANGSPGTPNHAASQELRTFGVIKSKVQKRRAMGSSKNTHGVTIRTRGFRGSKGKH